MAIWIGVMVLLCAVTVERAPIWERQQVDASKRTRIHRPLRIVPQRLAKFRKKYISEAARSVLAYSGCYLSVSAVCMCVFFTCVTCQHMQCWQWCNIKSTLLQAESQLAFESNGEKRFAFESIYWRSPCGSQRSLYIAKYKWTVYVIAICAIDNGLPHSRCTNLVHGFGRFFIIHFMLRMARMLWFIALSNLRLLVYLLYSSFTMLRARRCLFLNKLSHAKIW